MYWLRSNDRRVSSGLRARSRRRRGTQKKRLGGLLLGTVAPVAVGRVARVAREDLDAAPGTPDVFGAGRLAVAVVFSKRTLPARAALDDGRVFGIGTPFGLGIVCGHGRSLQRPTGSRVPTTRALSRPEEPTRLTYTHKGTRYKDTDTARNGRIHTTVPLTAKVIAFVCIG